MDLWEAINRLRKISIRFVLAMGLRYFCCYENIQ